jgi:hypothetical protein
MFSDKKNLSIIALCITAALLLLGNFFAPTVRGDVVIKDRDYQLITGHGSSGGDDLYILDNRTGLMAVFVFDPNRHSIFPRAFTSVVDLFGNAPRR